MKTKIIKIKSKKDYSLINEAASIIKSGEVVAFPTETVYGLGANALNKNAVDKIFKAKGRPSDNPLIVHISSYGQLKQLTSSIPKEAKILSNKFWPGPLTLILKKSKIVPNNVTANLNTVAIRMPSHPIALELIKQSNTPIAAPSANLSTKPSTTNAQHVYHDLKGRIPLIIDGGSSSIGLESTVLDLTQQTPIILRPGKITKEQIEKVLNKNINVHSGSSNKPSSPGMKYKHYSPNAKLILFNNSKTLTSNLPKYKNKNIAIITPSLYKNLNDLAKNLTKDLRELDILNTDIIFFQTVPKKGIGTAIMNRLEKAADDVLD